jgi:hypothetical protein
LAAAHQLCLDDLREKYRRKQKLEDDGRLDDLLVTSMRSYPAKRKINTLFSDVETLSAVRIVISTAEEFAKNWIVSVEKVQCVVARTQGLLTVS